VGMTSVFSGGSTILPNTPVSQHTRTYVSCSRHSCIERFVWPKDVKANVYETI